MSFPDMIEVEWTYAFRVGSQTLFEADIFVDVAFLDGWWIEEISHEVVQDRLAPSSQWRWVKKALPKDSERYRMIVDDLMADPDFRDRVEADLRARVMEAAE